MTASMPFRPAEWAENPISIKAEKITARVDLPRIDLSRFASLVAAARKISGTVTGNVEVAGEARQTGDQGQDRSNRRQVRIEGRGNPAMSPEPASSVDLALDRITLRDLKATVAGGTLQGGGSLAIDNGKPGALDFRMTGNHLPLKRDDSLIVRANADLRLAGHARAGRSNRHRGRGGQPVLSGHRIAADRHAVHRAHPRPRCRGSMRRRIRLSHARAIPRTGRSTCAARTENPFLIRGNLATGRVDANLRVGGTLGKPAPDGEVRISDLKAALPFSTLRFAPGTVRFTPANGFDPVLEIRGTAEPRPYRVNVFVYGTRVQSAAGAHLDSAAAGKRNHDPARHRHHHQRAGRSAGGLVARDAIARRGNPPRALRRGQAAPPACSGCSTASISASPRRIPIPANRFPPPRSCITDRWYLSAGMGGEGDSRVLGIWRLSFR